MSAKAEEDAAARPANIAHARRKLSVVGNNALVDGLEALDVGDDGGGDSGGAAKSDEGVITQLAGVSKKGYAPYNPRKKNQDALAMLAGPDGSKLLLCLDGHGEAGDDVSGFLKVEFPKALFAHPEYDTNVEKAIADSIVRLERVLLSNPRIDTEFSGTTFVCGVIQGDQLIVGNVGDSRLTLGCAATPDAPLTALAVSIDHKPDLPAEKERIVKTGGRVFAVEYDDGVDGPPRVWLGHMDVPGLAMSRSLGDTVAHSAGVSSEPEFFRMRLTEEHRCLVIASDGLWEFMDDQCVVDMIGAAPSATVAVDTLVQEANTRWMREEQVIDDTTVCVAFLGGWKEAS